MFVGAPLLPRVLVERELIVAPIDAFCRVTDDGWYYCVEAGVPARPSLYLGLGGKGDGALGVVLVAGHLPNIMSMSASSCSERALCCLRWVRLT